MKKNVGAILIGLWTFMMLSFHLRFSLQKAFGINSEWAFTDLASSWDNAAIFVVAFLAVASGVFIASYVERFKYWPVGMWTLGIILFFSGTLVVLVAIFAGAYKFHYFLFWFLAQICGGVFGVLSFQYLNHLRCGDFVGGFYDYLNYFFARRWRSFFTIILFVAAIDNLVSGFPAIVLFLKWLFLAPIFIVLHPTLWAWALFRDSLMGIISPLVLLAIPLYFLHLTHEVGTSNKSAIKKIILLVLFYFGLYISNTVAIGIVRSPSENSIREIAIKGGKVWPILLDRYTRPMASESRVKYLEKHGDELEAKEVRRTAIDQYFLLAESALKGKDRVLLDRSIDRIFDLSEKDPVSVRRVASLYSVAEIYDKAAELLEDLYRKSPSDLEILDELINCYAQLDDRGKLLPLLKVKYSLTESTLSDDERRKILDAIAEIEKGTNVIPNSENKK